MTRFLLAFTLLAFSPAALATPAEKEVLAAMELWKRAMLTKDLAAFDQVFHPDLTYGHSSGLLENKTQAIDHVVKSTTVYDDVRFADTRVSVTGKTALVTGKVQYLKHPKDQKVIVQDLATLSVWVKTARGWQLRARQATLTNREPAPGEALGHVGAGQGSEPKGAAKVPK
jgi:ketosteroid isomerase-like protein